MAAPRGSMVFGALLCLVAAFQLICCYDDLEHQLTYSKALTDGTSFLSHTEENDLPIKFLPQSKERHTRQARTDGEEKYLLFGNRGFLVQLYLNGTVRNAFQIQRANIIAVDFDARESLMFWSDVFASHIAVAGLDGSGFRVLINADISIPDGLAYDWITKKLYWTDAFEKDIEVFDIESSHRKVLLNSSETSQLRAIVLDPQNRVMYLTDWGLSPKIEKASMDGGARRAIVTTDIVWPNGITLDYDTQTLYWIDAALGKIESCNTNGNNRMVLNNNISHPFGITFYQDSLYWGDWATNTIYSVSLTEPNASTAIINLINDPMSIHVVSTDRQPPANNPCSLDNGGCNFLCLLSSTSSQMYTCHCPNGLDINSDGKTCNISTFGFETTNYSVLEAEEQLTVCLTSEKSFGPDVFSLTLIIVNLTTNGQADHEVTERNLIFSVLNKTNCITISIINDDNPEPKEIFQLHLTNIRPISPNVNAYNVHHPVTTITIIDDDVICDPSCENGVCVFPGFCRCDEGWTGTNCSQGLYVTIDVEYTRPADFNLISPPNYKTNTDVTFTCRVEGASGDVKYQWSSTADRELPADSNSQVLTKNMLDSYDTGNYTCTAMDANNNIGSGTTEVEVIVDFQVSMQIQNTTEPVHGEPFTLTCTATITPDKHAPQLLQNTILGWLGPDGEELNSNSDIIVGQQETLPNKTTTTLMFNPLSFLHEKTYKCQAKVDDTEIYDVSSFYIDVIERDIIQLKFGPILHHSQCNKEKGYIAQLESDTKTALVTAINNRCNCSFLVSAIDLGEFTSSHTGRDVFYRARITTTVVGELNNTLQSIAEWIKTERSFLSMYDGRVRLWIDCDVPLRISSFFDLVPGKIEECE